MRLKLVLKIVEGTVLPCNYMYELSSCLYKVLNEGNRFLLPGYMIKDIVRKRKHLNYLPFRISIFRVSESRGIGFLFWRIRPS